MKYAEKPNNKEKKKQEVRKKENKTNMKKFTKHSA